jgi:hypothetical protein
MHKIDIFVDMIGIRTICLQYLTGMKDTHHLKMHLTTLLQQQMAYLWIGSVITLQLQYWSPDHM